MDKAITFLEEGGQNIPPGPDWSGWQKNAFRFFFLLLGATSITGYNILLTVLNFSWDYSGKIWRIFNGLVSWTDRHFTHLGYDPKKNASFFGDGAFGWNLLIILFFLSIVVTIIWALADRNRKNYNRLHYWFRVYLSYYLFLAMIIYAVEKIIPVQMPYPNVDSLSGPFGELNRFSLVWNFIGISPAYSFFTGTCELIGSLLLLSRRTRVFGTLFMTTVLTNVVCLNLFYNIPVKILCIQLLVMNLFLLVPYLPRLFRFFYSLQPVSLAEKQYRFQTPWKKYTMYALLLAPLWVSYLIINKSMGMYSRDALNRKNQRFYAVTRFIKGQDTLPPLLTDSLVWKRFAITAYRESRYVVIYNMQNGMDYYDYEIDSIKKTITLHDNPDTLSWHVFHYTYPANDKYMLSGIWKGQPVQIFMKALSIDSLYPLTREKITWVQNF